MKAHHSLWATCLIALCMPGLMMMDLLDILMPHLSALMCFPVTYTLHHLSGLTSRRSSRLSACQSTPVFLPCALLSSCHSRSSTTLCLCREAISEERCAPVSVGSALSHTCHRALLYFIILLAVKVSLYRCFTLSLTVFEVLTVHFTKPHPHQLYQSP